jgi:hypothetical protein
MDFHITISKEYGQKAMASIRELMRQSYWMKQAANAIAIPVI